MEVKKQYKWKWKFLREKLNNIIIYDNKKPFCNTLRIKFEMF